MGNRILLAAVVALGLLVWIARGLRDDLRHPKPPEDPEMSYLQVVDELGEVMYFFLGEEAYVALDAANEFAGDSANEKRMTWTTVTGVTATLVVPAKEGEDPLGPAHCSRFDALLTEVQMQPNLRPQ